MIGQVPGRSTNPPAGKMKDLSVMTTSELHPTKAIHSNTAMATFLQELKKEGKKKRLYKEAYVIRHGMKGTLTS